jgi:HAD superfamily hydrolase (TIGR01509 family)
MSSVEWARHIAQLLREPALAPEINTVCVEYVVAAIRRGEGPIIDGAGPLLAAAGRGGPVALASSAPRRVIEAALEQHDLAGAFTTTVSSDEVAHGKPRPDVFLEAARRIGVTAADGLGVEDTSNGIRAAAAAGLVVLAIPNRRYPPAPDALGLAEFVTNDYDAARRYVERRMALDGAGRFRPG